MKLDDRVNPNGEYIVDSETWELIKWFYVEKSWLTCKYPYLEQIYGRD